MRTGSLAPYHRAGAPCGRSAPTSSRTSRCCWASSRSRPAWSGPSAPCGRRCRSGRPGHEPSGSGRTSRATSSSAGSWACARSAGSPPPPWPPPPSRSGCTYRQRPNSSASSSSSWSHSPSRHSAGPRRRGGYRAGRRSRAETPGTMSPSSFDPCGNPARCRSETRKLDRDEVRYMGSSDRDALSVARTLLAALGAQDIDTVVACFADDAVQEMPFAPPGFPAHREGIEAISQMYGGLPQMATSIGFTILQEYPMADPDWGLLEYRGKVDLVAGNSYENHYFGLVHGVDGKIKLFREILNPLGLLDAFSTEARAAA